jgi:hypothetical protein
VKAAILPYKLGNTYSKELAVALGGFRINPAANTYRRQQDHRIINWGCSHTHYQFEDRDFNHPSAVARAVNKLASFEVWKREGVECPDFTTSRQQAQQWLNNGSVVYARDRVTGARGEGITVLQPWDDAGNHRFWTKAVDIVREYRIHAAAYGAIIDVTQKLRRNGHPDVNPLVRTSENGWVFCRNRIIQPRQSTLALCARAVSKLGLDFGGVDCCETHNGAVVFEVNTAPAIEGTTIQHYVDFFKGFLNG